MNETRQDAVRCLCTGSPKTRVVPDGNLVGTIEKIDRSRILPTTGPTEF